MAFSPLLTALLVLRLVGPGVPLLIALSLALLRPASERHDHDDSPIISVIVTKTSPRRALILSFLSIIAATFFIDGALIVAHAILTGIWEGSTPQWRLIEVVDVLGLCAFAGTAALGTWKDVNDIPVWTRCRVKFLALFAFAVDAAQITLLSLSMNFLREDSVPGTSPISRLDLTNTAHFGLIILRLLTLLILIPTLYNPRISYVPASRDRTIATEEANASTSLLVAPLPISSHYGTFSSAPQTPHSITRSQTPAPVDGATNLQVNPSGAPAPLKPNPRKEVNEDPSWKELGQRLRKLAPYLWPKKDKGLQLLAAVCIVLLSLGRLVNVLLPVTLGKVVSALEQRANSNPNIPLPSPWPSLLFYVVLRFLQSPGGLAALRDTLWAPVMQYSDREMSQLSFDHLLNLSLAFHTRRKTGEVLRILDRGAAINHIFELLLFNIGPIFFDIAIALVFFFYLFGWPLALVIAMVMVAYVYASVIMTRWRTKIRRRMNDRDVITRGIHTDCLLNYETVKYFNGEQHEGERYQEAIREYQALEYRVMVSLNLLNLVQNLIFSLGILVGSLLIAAQITEGRLNSNGVPMAGSDFVVFITYLAQLYGPLNSLGYIYRSINQNLVDTERLMKLLDEPEEVKDKPGAPDLEVTAGEIEFQSVSFSYDGRTTALNNVSFKVPKGSSVALVGESGSGKSTILRLLYRFYDLKDTEGRILIDGQDIREVTQHSLRKAIGVVPQDSVLFNTSIGYNIGYGKFGATPAELEAAAQAAQMHERIMSFPDGYDTKVGERGVRLSGGEKQRVAIARTLLKNPPILLLDEATSALDTSTEKDIQKALQNLVKGRSSLSIAHRLSTIANADIILVLKEGHIVESGSFRELLALNGVFASMWADQVSADEEAQLPPDQRILPKEVAGYRVDIEAEPEEKEDQAPEVRLPDVQGVYSEPEDPFADPFLTATENQSAAQLTTGTPIVTESPQALNVELPEDGATDRATAAARPKSYAEVASANALAEDLTFTPFPSSEPAPEASPAPIAFPSSPGDVSFPEIPNSPVSPSGGGVHFVSGVDTPPSRSGTPDPEGAKYKRIRKTSQNIQKFARSLSFAGRRQSSGVVSSVTRVDSNPTPRNSREDSSATARGEGSVTGGDSATDGSVPVSPSDDKKEARGKGQLRKGKKSGSKGGK